MAAPVNIGKVLPDDFPATVFELEMNIETGTITTDAVNKLTALYMDAVEYHAAAETGKAPYFQDKLTRLLSNAQIYEKIEQEKPRDRRSSKVILEIPAKPSGKFNSKKQMELNMIMGEKKSEKITDNLLKTYGSNYSTLDKLVEGNLKKQESDIQKRLEQRKLNRSLSQSKKSLNNSLVLLSPCTTGKPENNVQSLHLHNIPLTPRQPSSEDPYGLGAFSNKKKTEEPVITKESLLEPKTEPSNKGNKANFFNKLKKSAGAAKEEAPIDPKTEPSNKGSKANFFNKLKKSAGAAKVEVPQKSEERNISEFDPRPAENLETKPYTQDQAPAIQTPKEIAKPEKKPKIVIQINNEEEINALKEELEILELQLAGEEDETAQEEWKKEISRVKEQIQLKSVQPEPSKDTADTAETESPMQVLKSPAQEIQEKPVHSAKSRSDQQDPFTVIPTVVEEPTGESMPKKKDAFGSLLNKLKNKAKASNNQ